MDTKRLKELRISHGLTQADVADHLGVDTSQYCRIEKGDRKLTIDEAMKLAKLYHCSMDQVLGEAPWSPATQSFSATAPARSEKEQFLHDQLERRDLQLDQSQTMISKLIALMERFIHRQDDSSSRT